MSFVILRDNNGKPVRNASVVLHSVNRHGKQAKGGQELKADADGKSAATPPGFHTAWYGCRVLAPGFQTYGQDYDVDKPTIALTIKLKRPEEQYSIYGDQQATTRKMRAPPAGAKPK